jgi:hypothetical protein
MAAADLTPAQRLERLERAVVVLIRNINRVARVRDEPGGPLDQLSAEDLERRR